jgi:23S rRNA (adenine-N6)-dimethyltransferase
LTDELARAAGEVIAVELDVALVRALRARSWPNVRVVHGDAATVQLPAVPFRVVANLPFAGANAILRHLLDDGDVPLVRADVIVEWGAAVKRALPWPSTASGVIWGARYRFAVDRRLPRSAFAPEPSVEAGVLVIERRARPLVPETLLDRYTRFVAKAFRRGVPGGRRVQARDLDAHQWAELFKASLS